MKKTFADKPRCAKAYEHSITSNSDKHIIRRNYPISMSKLDATRKALDEMLKLGIIEPSTSPYYNSLRIVDKKDGKVRPCLDALFINEYIDPEYEGPVLIDEPIRHSLGKTIFMTTDRKLGYYHIPLEKESKKHTAFVFDGKVYQFTRVPFGLKIAGNAFVRAMKKTI